MVRWEVARLGHGIARPVAIMAAIRVLSGLLEIVVAFLFLRANRVSFALRANSVMGLAGPLFFLSAGAVGLSSLRHQAPAARLLAIAAGILLVLWGTAGL